MNENQSANVLVCVTDQLSCERLIRAGAALVQKYGEGSAELACQMYDAIAAASAAGVPPAAHTPSFT